MKSYFQKNLKELAKRYSQKYIADKTGFSQSSINNYLTKNSDPSIQFLIALKESFGINVDDFLFGGLNMEEQISYERYIGNYLVYYFNNDSYKGEVHSNLKNTLNYGVISIFKEKDFDKDVKVLGAFTKSRVNAVKVLKDLNAKKGAVESVLSNCGSIYAGEIDVNEKNIFITLNNAENSDRTFIALNNPPSNASYIGGAGTVNSISRGREHNPCVQYIIISKKILDLPDGEIYDILHFNNYTVDIEDNIKEIVTLFKRLYCEKNELSAELSDNQKLAIVKNRLDFLLSDVLSANAFRFAKMSNREDDTVYRLIKEGIDV